MNLEEEKAGMTLDEEKAGRSDPTQKIAFFIKSSPTGFQVSFSSPTGLQVV
jgi:hypothetical protein